MTALSAFGILILLSLATRFWIGFLVMQVVPGWGAALAINYFKRYHYPLVPINA